MGERNVDLQEGIRLRSVRRRLFPGDDDEEISNGRSNNGEQDNLANIFFEETRQNREDAKKKWNFDFENEVPLPGRYEWVKLDRDGNEISDSVQSNNGVEISRTGWTKEAEASVTKETGRTENDERMVESP